MADATLVLSRTKAYVDKVRAYRILLDGQEIGRIKEGTEEKLMIPSGSHELQLKIDWSMSPPAHFDAAEGETVTFTCKPRPNALTALWYATAARKKYIDLTRIQP